MSKHWLLAAVPAALIVGVALAQQYPMLDQAAAKVIQKYQSSTCEQLWQNRGKQNLEEQRVIGFLRSDPTMREYFINKTAGPVAKQDVRVRDDPVISVIAVGIRRTL